MGEIKMSLITEENNEAFNAYLDMQGINWARVRNLESSVLVPAFLRTYIGSVGLVYVEEVDGFDVIEHNGPDKELAEAVGIDWDNLEGEEIGWAWDELESAGKIEAHAFNDEVYFFLHPFFADELGR
jgi:hypothetical protein